MKKSLITLVATLLFSLSSIILPVEAFADVNSEVGITFDGVEPDEPKENVPPPSNIVIHSPPGASNENFPYGPTATNPGTSGMKLPQTSEKNEQSVYQITGWIVLAGTLLFLVFKSKNFLQNKITVKLN